MLLAAVLLPRITHSALLTVFLQIAVVLCWDFRSISSTAMGTQLPKELEAKQGDKSCVNIRWNCIGSHRGFTVTDVFWRQTTGLTLMARLRPHLSRIQPLTGYYRNRQRQPQQMRSRSRRPRCPANLCPICCSSTRPVGQLRCLGKTQN